MGDHLAIIYLGTEQEASELRRWIRDTKYQGSRVYHFPAWTDIPETKQCDLLVTSLHDGVHSIVKLKQRYPEVPILYFGEDELLADQMILQGGQDYLPRKELTADTLARIITFSLDREKLTCSLREKSLMDELTGIYNRRGFMAQLRHHISLAQRSQEPFLLFFFDLDFFKRINDQYGHLAGDQVLIATAKALQLTFRSQDVIGRWGGDEFTVLAYRSSAASRSSLKKQWFQRIKDLNTDDMPYTISCSIGCACYPDDGITIEALLAAADRDLYQEKKLRHCTITGGSERI